MQRLRGLRPSIGRLTCIRANFRQYTAKASALELSDSMLRCNGGRQMIGRMRAQIEVFFPCLARARAPRARAGQTACFALLFGLASGMAHGFTFDAVAHRAQELAAAPYRPQ